MNSLLPAGRRKGPGFCSELAGQLGWNPQNGEKSPPKQEDPVGTGSREVPRPKPDMGQGVRGGGQVTPCGPCWHRGVMSSMSGPHPLNARSTPSCDDHRCPQPWPSIPAGRVPLGETI